MALAPGGIPPPTGSGAYEEGSVSLADPRWAHLVERMARHVAQGLCRDCTAMAEPGTKYCSYHLQSFREFQRHRRAAARKRGHCIVCCRRPHRPGRATCEVCGARRKPRRVHLRGTDGRTACGRYRLDSPRMRTAEWRGAITCQRCLRLLGEEL